MSDSPPTATPASAAAPAPGPDERLDPVGALRQRLGAPLTDAVTALAALTHKSFVNEHREPGLGDNERLEFLGDAVIDLAVSHRLMERFPSAREGDLSKMRAAVVDEQGLAAMARTLGLGDLLRLGRGEELTGGRQKASLLADAMEAVVAAVYLETGLPGVLALVDRFLGEAFARAAAGTLDRDFKTQLQEQAQSRLRATPRYRVVAETGPDHAKVFEVELDLKGEILGRATGKSKKDAEQSAAKLGLEALAAKVAAAAAEAASPPAPAPLPVPADLLAAPASLVDLAAAVEPVVAPPPAPPAAPPVPEAAVPETGASEPAAAAPAAPAAPRQAAAGKAGRKPKAAPKGAKAGKPRAAPPARAGKAAAAGKKKAARRPLAVPPARR